jgi:hypothetical protein
MGDGLGQEETGTQTALSAAWELLTLNSENLVRQPMPVVTRSINTRNGCNLPRFERDIRHTAVFQGWGTDQYRMSSIYNQRWLVERRSYSEFAGAFHC